MSAPDHDDRHDDDRHDDDRHADDRHADDRHADDRRDDGQHDDDRDDAERIQRADRATRGGLAAVLALEAVVTLLVPRALAFSSGGLGVTKTLLLIALAIVMIAAAGLLRRPWGIGLGSAVQVLFLLSGLWLIAQLVIAALFAMVWARMLWLRHQLLGTPTGWRLLSS